MMHNWNMDWGWGGMWFGPAFMIILVVAAILLIAAVVRALGSASGSGDTARPTPRQILDERFAKGEIDQEEYESRRKLLSS